jgi:hypothetical protein
MPFNDFPEDTELVRLEKKDGSTHGPFKALLGGETIILHPESDVEEGDVILRQLPSGREERRHVTEAEFYRGSSSEDDHFQVKFRKGNQTNLPKPGNTFHIHGSQVQIGDHNTQNIVNALQGLKEKIESANASPEQKHEAAGLLRSLATHPLVTSVLGGLAGGIV